MSVAAEQRGRSSGAPQADKLLITTHENPDGDALGSLLAFDEMMRALGKDTVMFMSADNFPLPHEYRTCRSRGWSAPPADMDERTPCSSTAGTSTACRSTSSSARAAHPQHRPPPRQHPLRHGQPGGLGALRARPRSSGSSRRSWASRSRRSMAEALYIALITDTGRFMYENTDARAHLMAAELIEPASTSPRSTASLPGPAVPAPAAAGARAGGGRALRRRRA